MKKNSQYFKRNYQSIDSHRRVSKAREPYDYVLIICEGKKTEPNYLNGLCSELRLSSVNIVVKPCDSGNDPVSISEAAIEENKKEAYDRIYCVFDKDQHSNYQAALNQISTNKRNGIPISAITSVPCFEYWLLLHFEDTSRPYHPKGSKSSGAQLKSELKKYMKNYHEADAEIFNTTKPYLQEAIERAKRISKLQKQNDTDNPSTNFYALVEYLQKIRS